MITPWAPIAPQDKPASVVVCMLSLQLLMWFVACKSFTVAEPDQTSTGAAAVAACFPATAAPPEGDSSRMLS